MVGVIILVVSDEDIQTVHRFQAGIYLKLFWIYF